MLLQTIWEIHSVLDIMNEILNTGIIGVGNIGSAHAAAIYSGRVRGMRLSALCDTDAERRKKLSEVYPDIPVFESAEELISSGKAQAVIIATPHYGHVPIAVKAFAAGLHVLTEKPAGVACADVRSAIYEAEKSGKKFAVMFNQRTNKLFRAAKDIVSSGCLGEIKRISYVITNWYRKQSYYDSGDWRATWSGEGGGVLINQAPHNLDILQWICGMPESVYAVCGVGRYHDINVEDDATLLMRYKNGATAVFIASTGEFPGTNRLEICGTRGKILIENGKLTHTSLAMDEREYRYSSDSYKNEISVCEVTDEKYNGHINILENFASSVLLGEALIARGEEAIAELTLSNAAYLSSWLGKEITLPMDDVLYADMLKGKAEAEVSERREKREELQFSYKERWNTQW